MLKIFKQNLKKLLFIFLFLNLTIVSIQKIPNLAFLTLKVSYFQEMISEVKNYEDFKMWETEDKSFRVNLITFPAENNKKDIIIFFRGTEAWRIKNIMADFNLSEINLGEGCDNCLIQQGYLDAFKSVELNAFKFIKDQVGKITSEGKEINYLYFSGHSLGGAMAEIATHFFLNLKDFHSNDPENSYTEKINKISLITFGAPKIGNENYVSRMEKDLRISDNIRVVYGIDDVPFFPPEKLQYSQSHNGDLIYFRQLEFYKYNIIVGFERGSKKEGEITPEDYLKKVNDEQRSILNFHERVLDHLKYADIPEEVLTDAIMKIRKMEEGDNLKFLE